MRTYQSQMANFINSRFYLYTVAIFPNPNPTRNPGLVAFHTRKPVLAKRLRVWNPYFPGRRFYTVSQKRQTPYSSTYLHQIGVASSQHCREKWSIWHITTNCTTGCVEWWICVSSCWLSSSSSAMATFSLLCERVIYRCVTAVVANFENLYFTT